ncbi:MAG TPA: ATP-binding cassette domain-containing protein [Chitinophagaceae bacterium]|nr:ATP-binding cassette domain-containing protein [Chitinophagaceae bacterium]
MESVVTIQGISKNYGNIQALNQVSFTVPVGSVFGLLGPNGSGKTTMLGIIMDILRPSSGTFMLFEQPPSAMLRKQIGTLLETPNFYHYLSGEDNLVIAANIKGRGTSDIPRVLEKVGLTNRKNSRFNTYSLGMKQRLAIAAALLGNPSVLVLDEPANGLDPVGIAEIRELIQLLALEGKTIIMASHLLDEVEKVCTHVAILKTGNLLLSGPVDEVLVSEDSLEVAASDLGRLREVLASFPGLKTIREHQGSLQLTIGGKPNPEELNRHCFSQGITLNLLRIRKKSLETKFIELTSAK